MICRRSMHSYSAFFAVLLVITIYNYSDHTRIIQVLSVFERQTKELGLSKRDLDLFEELLRVFENIAASHNVTYFLYGGTLMGYVRNGTLLPWDDDLDLAMDADKYDSVVGAVNKLDRYSTYLHAGWILKIFANSNGTYVYNYQDKWHWPFLDVFLFKNLSESVCQDAAWGLKFATRPIFPLQRAKLLGVDVFVPNNYSYVLDVMYGSDAVDICESNYLNHKYVQYEQKTVKIECEKLRYLYHWTN